VSITFRRALAGGIRAERARLGITQEELGRRIGRAKQTVSEIEAGTASLAAEDLPDVCRALGCTLAELLDRADPADRGVLGV
jgi:transcriptional regulator with XRE-family HTH domain